MKAFYKEYSTNSDAPPAYTVIGAPASLEIHISRYVADATFPKRFGASIKAAGGRYSNIRRLSSDQRYITIPLRVDTRDLINAVVALHKDGNRYTTIVGRHTSVSLPSWVDVQRVRSEDGPDYVQTFIEAYERALTRAAKDGAVAGVKIGSPPTESDKDRLTRVQKRLLSLHYEADRLHKALARVETKIVEDSVIVEQLKGKA